MARRKPLYAVIDFCGDEWDVFDERPTPLGWPVLMGRPSIERNELRTNRVAVILAGELPAYLQENRLTKLEVVSPATGISRSVLKRLRKEIGLNRYDDIHAWWESRIEDLRTLTIEAFAAKHSVKVGAVEYWRLRLIGATNRPNGWYRDEAVIDALLSPEPAAAVAEFLGGIAPSSVGRLRSKLAAEGQPNPVPANDRISSSKAGIPAHKNTREALNRAAKREKSRHHRANIAESLRKYHRENPENGIGNRGLRAWTPDEDAVIGTSPDRVIAKQLGRTVPSIRMRRKVLGIPAFRLPWTVPIGRTPQAVRIGRLVTERYETVAGAARVTPISYKDWWTACDGRRSLGKSTMDKISALLGIDDEQ